MAKSPVGIAAVEAVFDDKGLETGLRRASEQIKRFSRSAKKDLGDVDAGFVERLSKHAKSIKKENRSSGESALESFLGGGARGILNFGLESMGAGLVGLLVDQVGKAAVGILTSANQAIDDYITGKKGPATIAGDVQRSIPFYNIGYEGGRQLQDLAGNLLGRDQFMGVPLISPETREKRARAFETAGKASLSQMRMSSYDRQIAQTNNPFEKQKLSSQKETQRLRDDFANTMNDLDSSQYTVEQKASLRAAAHMTFTNRMAELSARSDEDRKKVYIGANTARQGTSLSMIGNASGTLSMMQANPGGDSAEAQKVQKMLSVYQNSVGMNMQLDKVINDETASPKQREAAQKQKLALRKWTEYATSDKYLNAQPDAPLRFASADYASSRYSGAAQYAFEASLDKSSNTAEMKDAQQQTNEYLKIIAEGLPNWLANSAGAPVLPNAGGMN